MFSTVNLVSVVAVLFGASQAREFQIKNTMGSDIWVGIQGNPGKENLHNGGFVLHPGQQMSVFSADDWAGRFWARTGCDPNSQHCETGDCGNKLECAGAGGAPPVTLVEITLKGAGGLDYYDTSLVDGFNVPASMEPLGGHSDGSQYSCKRTQCRANINGECPDELRDIVGGRTVGCKSACLAFNTDEYCCRNAHKTPETCKESDMPTDYPKFFKDRCPDSYSYAYDDHKATFTCPNPPAYYIQFGA